MANVVKSPKKAPRTKTELPPLPRLQGTYTQILVRAIESAQSERRFTQKIRSATRELAAMVPHTKERWSALSIVGKMLTVVFLVGLGGLGTYVGMQTLMGPKPKALRAEITTLLEQGNYVSAKRTFNVLTTLDHGLTPDERWKLLGSIQAGLNHLQGGLQQQVRTQSEAEKWDAALAALDKLDEAELIPEWSLFTRADVLRKAGRHQEARTYFGRYAELYPTTERTDDALFWQAASLRDVGDKAGARVVLEKILADHPQSNFKNSARRWLAELDAAASAKEP